MISPTRLDHMDSQAPEVHTAGNGQDRVASEAPHPRDPPALALAGAGIYLVAAWIALQGSEALVSGLGLLERVPGLAVLVLILGLSIVVGPRQIAGEQRQWRHV